MVTINHMRFSPEKVDIASLQEQKNRAEAHPRLTLEAWRKLVPKIESNPKALKQLKAILERVIARLKNETDVEVELEGIVPLDAMMDMKTFLETHPKRMTREQIEAVFRVPEKLFPKIKGVRLGIVNIPTASAHFGRIYTPDTFPVTTPLQEMSYLTLTGLPDDFITILHELIHTLQISSAAEQIKEIMLWTARALKESPFDLQGLLLQMNRQKLLIESQAHHAMLESNQVEGTPLAIMQKVQDRLSWIIKGTTSSAFHAVHKPPTSEQTLVEVRIKIAVVQIDELRALGYTHAEIAKLAAKGDWNDAKKCFDTFDDAIQTARQRRALSSSDLDELVHAKNLKRDIRSLQIMNIAQEELVAEFSDTIGT